MAAADAGIAKDVGVFGFGYNRANYKFDQQLRWQRYCVGRNMAIAQANMFREDVLDLAQVAMSKLKIYAPILTMAMGWCITVFVEGRSGLKFPAPPTFISGIYLQCLGIGFAFFCLGTWLTFHSAIRAQVMAVQLRTRKVRVPVPTQRQLDSARKCLSTFEEQNPYDMFRLPFVLPQAGDSPDPSDDEEDDDAISKSEKKYPKTTESIKAGAKTKPKAAGSKKRSGSAPPASGPPRGIRMPGLSKGAPSWMQKELQTREENPELSPSAHGKDGPAEPFEHFELVREAQKEFWSAEAYTRVCFLYGMIHLLHAFAYWLVIHNIAELGMVWGANVCGGLLTAAVWLIFRLDVLPENGGCLPVEAAGPFVSAMALTLLYTGNPTLAAIDTGRILAGLVLCMQVVWTARLYMLAKPGNGSYSHEAKENGGGMFNESGSCAKPSWLPQAFQHVTYLVAPPKTKAQLDQERSDRENSIPDPMTGVDMTPWRCVRALLVITFIGWFILLTGVVVEAVMGERMLTTNPGAPPWTRTGQWYGWEFGPISSKHYAHVTPQRGHFAWQKGWGPQGQQELWASDVFGFAPEADSWWSETVGPEPRSGAAGIGENTWAQGVLAYGQGQDFHASHPSHGKLADHDWMASGGHRRLASSPGSSVSRPLVPAAVQWPTLLEPELLACGPESMGSPVAAFTSNGMGVLIPPEAAAGQRAGAAKAFALDGLYELGMARGVTWGPENIYVVTGSGRVAACPAAGHRLGRSRCSPLEVPRLPVDELTGGAVMDAAEGATLRIAVAAKGVPLRILELLESGEAPSWRDLGELAFSLGEAAGAIPEVVSVTSSHGHLVATASDGAAYQWEMRDGLPAPEFLREAPSTHADRTWRSAVTLPTGKIMRLASGWRRSAGGAPAWRPELLL